MANEIALRWHDTGDTLYAQVLDATGQVYNGATFEAPADANWGDYDIPLTEAGTTRIYRATFPAVAAGVYTTLIYQQAGASPAVGDTLIGLGDMQWDGSAAVATSDLPTNAELSAAIAAGDDAVLAAVADVPTNAELAAAIAAGIVSISSVSTSSSSVPPWDIGDQVKVAVSFTDSTSVAADPTTVTVKVKPPGGVVTTYVYGTDAEVVKTAVGAYYILVTLDTNGVWYVRFEGTGAIIAAVEEKIYVRLSAF